MQFKCLRRHCRDQHKEHLLESYKCTINYSTQNNSAGNIKSRGKNTKLLNASAPSGHEQLPSDNLPDGEPPNRSTGILGEEVKSAANVTAITETYEETANSNELQEQVVTVATHNSRSSVSSPKPCALLGIGVDRNDETTSVTTDMEDTATATGSSVSENDVENSVIDDDVDHTTFYRIISNKISRVDEETSSLLFMQIMKILHKAEFNASIDIGNVRRSCGARKRAAEGTRNQNISLTLKIISNALNRLKEQPKIWAKYKILEMMSELDVSLEGTKIEPIIVD